MEHKEIPSKVGKSATKIWDAYQEVLEELKAVTATISISGASETAKVEAAIKAAESVDVEATAATLETVAAGLREAKGEFDEVNTAIDAMKVELKRIHNVQVEADSLVAMVEAKDRLVKERVEQANSTISEAREEAANILDSARTDAKDQEEATQAKAELSERDRKRSEEEWRYDFDRKKQAKIDEVGDIIAGKMRDLSARTEAVVEREGKADEIQAERDGLQVKLDVAAAEAKASAEAAYEEGKEKSDRSNKFARQMIEKDLNSKLDIANAKIETLTEQNAALQARLDKADSMIDSANDRVTSIATASLGAQGDAATISRVAEVAASSGGKGK